MIRRLTSPSNIVLRRWTRFLLAFLPLIAVTAFVVIARPEIDHLSRYGYAGVFAVMFTANATVFLPMPGLAAVTAAGMLWNPFIVGIAGGLGGATGELVGYLAGYGAHEIMGARRSPWFERVKGAVQRHGFFAILLLAAIPNPFFDIVGVAAGSVVYPPWRFYIAVTIGNAIKCTAVAFAGVAIISWFPGN